MEPSAKRIKLEKVNDEAIKANVMGIESPFETEFLDMNDDCILAICEFIKLDDLYSMGSTCVRINELAGNCFQRKFPNEWIDINYKRNRAIVFEHPNENAQKNFGKYFRSIRITGGKPIALRNMFEFIESKCFKELNHLELNTFYGELGEEHGTLIASKLINLKSIKINEFHIDGDIYAGILQHCKNIESFAIHTILSNDTNWMVQSYPMLLHFDITLDDRFHRKELKRSIKEFANKNPQLQTIKCSQIDVIRLIVSSEIKVPCLKIKFETETELKHIYYDLKLACDNEKIDQLELFMPNKNISDWLPIQMCHLADLKPLSVLRNTHYSNERHLLSMQHMINLRSLELKLGIRDEEIVDLMTIFSKIPKLVELDLLWAYFNVPSFYDLVLPIVRNSAKMTTLWLKPLSCYMNAVIWDLSCVVHLNLVRTLVSGAVPLTIYIEVIEEVFPALTAMLENIPVGDMVKIHVKQYILGM